MTEQHDPLAFASKPTLKRLPVYHDHLQKLATKGIKNVSSTDVARSLYLDPTQVRKDLAATGSVGTPRVGFNVKTTLTAIEEFLGWNNVQEAFLIGAGHLGSAIIGYEGFNQRGLRILAAFDADPKKIGTEIHGRPVYEIDRIADLAKRMKILIGILAVPADRAQEMANVLVLAGIKAIWNLTAVRLEAPDSIIVENVDLSASLAVLSSRLAKAVQNEPAEPGEQ